VFRHIFFFNGVIESNLSLSGLGAIG